MKGLGTARKLLYELTVTGRLWLTRRKRLPPANVTTAADKALWWLRANQIASGGIRVHSRSRKAYPEVTGYIVPTLLARQEPDFAGRLVQWLVSVQQPDGSFTDPDHGNPHVFDTAQALRGLLAGGDLVADVQQSIDKAAEYLVSRMVDGGRQGFASQYEDTTIQETIQLYSLPPLFEAARRAGRSEWEAAAERCLDYYLEHPNLLDLDNLTHFLAYELEALIDLGRADRARPVLDDLALTQAANGSVRARDGASWVCTPGLAQLAVCWYKLGQNQPADRALDWLRQHQRPTGGFLGSVGPAADYFPRTELSWAAKYFLDADRLRVESARQS